MTNIQRGGLLLCFSVRPRFAGIRPPGRDFFHGLDCVKKRVESNFVAQGIGVEQLIVRYAVSLHFRLDSLGYGQLCPDVEFELVQEGITFTRGAHRSSRLELSETG